MKSHYTFNTKSWHFKLASFSDSYLEHRTQMDFCRYLRTILKSLCAGTILVFIGSIAALGLFVMVGGLIAWILACLVKLSWLMPESEACVALLALVMAFIVGLIKITAACLDSRDYSSAPKKPSSGFFHVLYRKIKDKTCFQIDFE